MHGLTAKWADSWNTAWYGLPDDRFRERVEGMDAALAAAGRDPADLERTVGIIMVDPDERGSRRLSGTTEEIAAALGEYERRVRARDHVPAAGAPWPRSSAWQRRSARRG